MRWSSTSKVTPAAGWIEPCLPTVAKRAPTGDDWIFEIKHDGYRLMVRKHEERVRVFTRRGADWTKRFPRVVAAVRRLSVGSLMIDGEAIVYNKDGMPNFELLHSREYDKEVSLVAFDLLELDGAEVRRKALIDRKAQLRKLLSKVKDGIEYNDHIEGDGAVMRANIQASTSASSNISRKPQTRGRGNFPASMLRSIVDLLRLVF
ncbi:ATP-dependent DNA ligase [Bradyrhizobium sp. USDA 4452]